METIDKDIFNGGTEIVLQEIELKNVLIKGKGAENITVKVVPFDRYNDKHVEFAYAYSDMLFRAPSSFTNVSEASKAYVRLFVVHTEIEEKDKESTYNKVLADLRASRSLFNQDAIMLALNDFFENA